MPLIKQQVCGSGRTTVPLADRVMHIPFSALILKAVPLPTPFNIMPMPLPLVATASIAGCVPLDQMWNPGPSLRLRNHTGCPVPIVEREKTNRPLLVGDDGSPNNLFQSK